MDDAKHTKGPWKQGDGKRWDSHAIFTDDGTGFNGSGRFIARCEGATSGFDNDANARLIAAAPDLLAACLARIDEWHADNHNFTRKEPKSLSMMRAAVLKAAEGK